MGRVLLDYDPALVARHAGASEEETALIKKYLFGSEEWILLDKGTITEEEAIRRIQDRLPNERLRKLAKECLDCWHEYNISPKPGMDGGITSPTFSSFSQGQSPSKSESNSTPE